MILYQIVILIMMECGHCLLANCIIYHLMHDSRVLNCCNGIYKHIKLLSTLSLFTCFCLSLPTDEEKFWKIHKFSKQLCTTSAQKCHARDILVPYPQTSIHHFGIPRGWMFHFLSCRWFQCFYKRVQQNVR